MIKSSNVVSTLIQVVLQTFNTKVFQAPVAFGRGSERRSSQLVEALADNVLPLFNLRRSVH